MQPPPLCLSYLPVFLNHKHYFLRVCLYLCVITMPASLPHPTLPSLPLCFLLQCCEVALSLEPRLHPFGVSKDAVGYLAEHHSLRMDHSNPTTGGLRGDRRALLRALLLRGQRGHLPCPL